MAWLECQRCLAPYEQAFDAEVVYRVVNTEAEADEFPLDEDEVEVIVGSRQFDLVDLIEDELLLSLPVVPAHDVCPEVHESLVSGVGGADSMEDEAGPEEVDEGSGSGRPQSVCSAESVQAGRSGQREALNSCGERAMRRVGHLAGAIAGSGCVRIRKIFRSYHGSPAKQKIGIQARHAPCA